MLSFYYSEYCRKKTKVCRLIIDVLELNIVCLIRLLFPSLLKCKSIHLFCTYSFIFSFLYPKKALESSNSIKNVILLLNVGTITYIILEVL